MNILFILFSRSAEDFGGPRKEFFLLILLEIKEQYFDGGIKQDRKDEYYIIGLVMGEFHILCSLQWLPIACEPFDTKFMFGGHNSNVHGKC